MALIIHNINNANIALTKFQKQGSFGKEYNNKARETIGAPIKKSPIAVAQPAPVAANTWSGRKIAETVAKIAEIINACGLLKILPNNLLVNA